MVDSAMFYLIGTLYPLVARATYPALGFPQYPGEVGDVGRRRRRRRRRPSRDAEAALAEPLDVYRRSSSTASRSSAATRPRSPTSGWRRRSSSCNAIDYRSRLGEAVHGGDGVVAGRMPTPSQLPTCAATSPR
jgi:hypothetical protein